MSVKSLAKMAEAKTLALAMGDLLAAKENGKPRRRFEVTVVALDGDDYDPDTYLESLVISADPLSLGKALMMFAVLEE